MSPPVGFAPKAAGLPTADPVPPGEMVGEAAPGPPLTSEPTPTWPVIDTAPATVAEAAATCASALPAIPAVPLPAPSADSTSVPSAATAARWLPAVAARPLATAPEAAAETSIAGPAACPKACGSEKAGVDAANPSAAAGPRTAAARRPRRGAQLATSPASLVNRPPLSIRIIGYTPPSVFETADPLEREVPGRLPPPPSTAPQAAFSENHCFRTGG